MQKLLKKTLPPLRNYGALTLGILLMGLTYPLFFFENDLAPGGLSGVAMVLFAFWKVPVGLMTFLLNLPLFALSFREKGRGFVLRSFVSMLGVSVVIDTFPVVSLTTDPMLAAIFGGGMLGLGLGLVMRADTTTGGTDMAAALVHQRLPFISMGAVLMAIDFLVILGAGLVFELEAALYSLVTIFLSTRVMDRVVEGFNTAKAFIIISDEHEAITQAILGEMNRGVTLLKSRGAYSGAEREVLLCVIKRLQILQLKRIVVAADPHAFVIVTQVHEAMGEGFQAIQKAPSR